jgi:hypothetical protein
LYYLAPISFTMHVPLFGAICRARRCAFRG